MSDAGDSATPAAIERFKITFFCGSVIGYRGDPAALPTRALADALGRRGHMVRLTEERMNEAFKQTLREVGGDAVRTIHDTFPNMQIHTWEARQGAQLLEWLTRELALIDVAVVVGGAGELLTEWAAMIDRRGLTRIYLHWGDEPISEERAAALHLDRFDLVLSTGPEAVVGAAAARPHATLARSLAPQDVTAGITLPDAHAPTQADPVEVARAFEQIVGTLRRATITAPMNGVAAAEPLG